MSTENNTPVETTATTDDLDSFASDFFGQKTEAPASGQDAKETEDVTEKQETDAPENEDTQNNEDENLAPESEDNEDSEDGEEDSQPKKMSRAEKRISELNAKFREEERQRKALEEQVARILANQEKTEENKTQPKNNEAVDNTGLTGPSPDDTNEDGTDKYPLGELDPAYIRAVVRHEQELYRKEAEQEAALERRAQETEAARNAALADWTVKLEAAKQEKYTDFNEKSEALLETIVDIDDNYGEYLSTAIMDLDNGVDVLYYLASNPEEARQIVDLGPRKASLALGRLDASFTPSEGVATKVKRVSKAPTPPPVNKGSSPARMVTADTDDLDAFSNLLFKG